MKLIAIADAGRYVALRLSASLLVVATFIVAAAAPTASAITTTTQVTTYPGPHDGIVYGT